MIAALFIGLVACIVIGTPIAVSIGIASVVSMLQGGQSAQLFLVAQRMVTALDSTVLLGIPLFVLAGAIMGKGGLHVLRRHFRFRPRHGGGHRRHYDPLHD